MLLIAPVPWASCGHQEAWYSRPMLKGNMISQQPHTEVSAAHTAYALCAAALCTEILHPAAPLPPFSPHPPKKPDTMSGPFTMSRAAPASAAAARASTVFPLPGGPCSSTPRGGRTRRALNRWGARRGSATSSRRAAAKGAMPPRASNPAAKWAAKPEGRAQDKQHGQCQLECPKGCMRALVSSEDG